MPDLRDIDSELMFDPSAAWEIWDLLLEYLNSPDGEDARAIYTQSLQLTLGSDMAIREASQTNDIR